jgi:hypothetical protein
MSAAPAEANDTRPHAAANSGGVKHKNSVKTNNRGGAPAADDIKNKSAKSAASYSMGAPPANADGDAVGPLIATSSDSVRGASSRNSAKTVASTYTVVDLPDSCTGDAGYVSASITSKKEIVLVSVVANTPPIIFHSSYCQGGDYMSVCGDRGKCLIAMAYICGNVNSTA